MYLNIKELRTEQQYVALEFFFLKYCIVVLLSLLGLSVKKQQLISSSATLWTRKKMLTNEINKITSHRLEG